MTRRIAYIILSIAALLALLVGFLLSPLATPTIRWAANTYVESLMIEDVSGSLYSGLSVVDISYSLPSTSVKIGKLDIALDWNCTTTDKACISYLRVSNPNITLLESDTTSDANDEKTKSLFASPIALVVDEISIKDLKVSNEDFALSLTDFSTKMQFNKRLSLTDTRLTALLFESFAEPAPAKPFTGIDYTAPELPEVWVPLHADISRFTASEISYKNADATQKIKRLALTSLALKGDKIDWKNLEIDHESGQINTTGNTRLAKDYPLNAKLAAQVTLDEQEQAANLTVSGSLAALKTSATLSGLVNADAELTLSVLDNTLPINGRIHWPEQAIAVPQITKLNKGSLDITGVMGDYQLLIDSAAITDAVGEVVFNADLALSNTRFTINELDAILLGGTVITRGQVNFVDGLSGTGSTTIATINATPLLGSDVHASIPEASWQYKIQQGKSGVNVLVTDLDADIEYDQHVANVSGQAVYSQGQDLAVATLKAIQEDTNNRIELVGQILNQRVINVASDINLAEISDLYTDVKGQIKGALKVEGTWDDPQFNVDLDAENIEIAESLSPFVSDQGKVSAAVHGKGSLKQHQLSISAELKDYAAQLSFDGGLDQLTYRSQITGSTVNVWQQEWTLADPFSLTYNHEQQNLTASQHCWQAVNTTGDLCIAALDYAEENVAWELSAKELPAGVWAVDALPTLANVSESALLSLSSKGSYDLQSGPKLNAKLALGESTWTLNKDNPIAININTFTASASVDSNVFKTQALFVSDELGKVDFDFSGSSEDVRNGKVNGKLFVDNIQLQPLAKLSPSIYQLNGVINGQINVSGEARKPDLQGLLTLKNGIIDIEQSPLALSQWEQTLYLSGKKANVDGSFMLGDGNGSLVGMLSWEDTPVAELSLAADRISVTHDEIRLAVSPDLDAYITPDNVRVNGDINIPYARIKIDALPENAVTPSNDVYLRGEPENTDPLKNIIADIQLHIDEEKTRNVKLDAFGLTANLHGDLQINNQPSTVAYGDLQILDGRYKAYGQNLIIRTGEVQFNGPIGQPFLFVEAIRDPDYTSDGVIAGVRIDGAASKPTVSLFSEPPMDQSQNLLYLISGSGNLNNGGANSRDYQAALVGLGLSRSGAVTGSIGEALGIEDLAFSTTGQGEGTQVAMTGNLNDRLSVRFGVGLFDNSQEVAIRYQLMPQLYIEAVQRLSEAVSLIDLYYEFSLGKPGEEPDTQEQAQEDN